MDSRELERVELLMKELLEIIRKEGGAEQAAALSAGEIDVEHILPSMDDWEVFPREAVAVAMKAQEQGIARLTRSADELYGHASEIISRSRSLTKWMMEKGFIPPAPEE